MTHTKKDIRSKTGAYFLSSIILEFNEVQMEIIDRNFFKK